MQRGAQLGGVSHGDVEPELLVAPAKVVVVKRELASDSPAREGDARLDEAVQYLNASDLRRFYEAFWQASDCFGEFNDSSLRGTP